MFSNFFLSVWISGSVAVLVAVVLWFYLVADIVLSKNVATHVAFVSCADMHRSRAKRSVKL